MFSLIKLVIWISGIAVLAYFLLPYVGYEVNLNYFNQSKAKCQEQLRNCADRLVKEGTNNIKCDANCADPSLIIKKK